MTSEYIKDEKPKKETRNLESLYSNWLSTRTNWMHHWTPCMYMTSNGWAMLDVASNTKTLIDECFCPTFAFLLLNYLCICNLTLYHTSMYMYATSIRHWDQKCNNSKDQIKKVRFCLYVDREVLLIEVSLQCYAEDIFSSCKVWQLQSWENFRL